MNYKSREMILMTMTKVEINIPEKLYHIIKERIDLLKKNNIRISEKLYQKLQNYVGI